MDGGWVLALMREAGGGEGGMILDLILGGRGGKVGIGCRGCFMTGLRPPPCFVTAISSPRFNDNSSNNLRIAITGTVVVHALLFVLLAWLFAREAAHKLWVKEHEPPKEKEVTLLFPEQNMPLLAPPPVKPPPPKPEAYMRTSQNAEEATAPKNPSFISDRNTSAKSKMAPAPDGTEPLPTMNGLNLPSRELAERDFHDGKLRDDARPKSPQKSIPMMQPPPPAPPVAAQQPTPPTPAPQPPPKEQEQPKPAPQPQQMAKVDTTPLKKMMEEVDKDLAKVDKNRLPIEVKKPDMAEKGPDAPPKPEMKPVDTPVPPPTPKPEMAQQTPPETPMQARKALPVVDDEVITRTTPNQTADSFTPFTRKTQTKGMVANRGADDAVDAVGTPKGRYMKQVLGLVEQRWHRYVHLRPDVKVGKLQLVFYVNQQGKVEQLMVLDDKESNTVLTEITMQAIKDAEKEMPPMPPEVVPLLPDFDKGRLRIDYNVLLY